MCVGGGRRKRISDDRSMMHQAECFRPLFPPLAVLGDDTENIIALVKESIMNGGGSVFAVDVRLLPRQSPFHYQ